MSVFDKKILTLASLVLLLLPLAARADCPSIEALGRREALLANRIDSGVESGKISQAECLKLKRQLDKIAQDISKYARRRCLSNYENERFTEDLTGVSAKISRALHSRSPIDNSSDGQVVHAFALK